jgi:N-methylhydantoinase A/oxoprolinase/acetone carboxylase beta subunit
MDDSHDNAFARQQQVRVGIDVGGTFTDVVVIDHATQEVISQLKVPTTHDAEQGVARVSSMPFNGLCPT